MTQPAPDPGSGGSGPAGPASEPPRDIDNPFAPPVNGWQRLHPATPLFRGGIILLVVLSFVVGQLRDSLVQLVAGGVAGDDELPPDPQDPFNRWLLGHAAVALAIVAAVIVLVIMLGWLSWRMHEYRVTDAIVEEREGVIRRKHRRARIDRIQGVDIVRPLLPRIFGAARLDISVAGNDGNIRLAYLRSADADRLKSILLMAAGRARLAERGAVVAPGTAAGQAAGSLGATLDRRVQEFTASEFDDLLVGPGSIVRMHPGRLVGATALDSVPMLLWFAAIITALGVTARSALVLVTLIPLVIALGSYFWRRVSRSLRYSIAATQGGIRIGFGLLSTTNETLPPGRINAIEVTQPLLWRPFSWWRIRINRASTSSRDGADGQRNTTILPVGDRADVDRVVRLIVPGLDVAALLGGRPLPVDPDGATPDRPDFTTSPRRGAWFRWFSWRRNGYAFAADTVLLRKGALWRTLTIVPLARIQSLELRSGPLYRAARLRRVEVHTVSGAVRPTIGALDPADAERLWSEAESRTLTALRDAR